MKLGCWMVLIAAGLVVGCVPSIHGIATKENTVWDESLLGSWGEPDKAGDPNAEVWRFEKVDKEYTYKLTHTQHEKTGEFQVSLVQLGGELYLDLFPDENKDMENVNDLYQMHLVAAHLIMKVDETGEKLRLRFMDPDEVKKLVEKDPSLVKHEMRDDQVILTAGTDELQVFLLQYADQIFGDDDKKGSAMVKIASSKGN
jgi:hypothetical protein